MFLGLDASDWTAIGTLTLAAVTATLAVWGWRRDTRKRTEDTADAERQRAVERCEREDFEARQVVVSAGNVITVTTPVAYPIKRVEAYKRATDGRYQGIHLDAHEDPYVKDGLTYYVFEENASVEPPCRPVIRFVDWHGNRYYQYRGYTRRFGQNDKWRNALEWFDMFLRRGPSPD